MTRTNQATGRSCLSESYTSSTCGTTGSSSVRSSFASSGGSSEVMYPSSTPRSNW